MKILHSGLRLAAYVGVGAMLSAPAFAQTVYDPLHGYCAGSGQCADNGTKSPSTGTPLNFGFTVSPGPASGDFLVDVLVPTNELGSLSNFAVTGTYSGSATLFSATPWTSGNLDAYLGLSASPANPIGAYLPSTQTLDSGASGFFVFQVDLGTHTLQDPSNPNVNPLENISPGLPRASYIVGFLNEGTSAAPDWVATANSGAIFDTRDAAPVPGPTIGAGLPGAAFAALGMLWFNRQRRQRMAF